MICGWLREGMRMTENLNDPMGYAKKVEAAIWVGNLDPR